MNIFWFLRKKCSKCGSKKYHSAILRADDSVVSCDLCFTDGAVDLNKLLNDLDEARKKFKKRRKGKGN